METTVLLPVFAGLAGACGGSFAATAALRSLRGEQAVVGRSHCDGCGVTLGFAATTPILSYAAFGGACHHCQARIDPAHVTGEIVGAVVAATAFWCAPPAQATLISLMALVLLAASIIDQRTQRLPDILTLSVALLSLGLAALNGQVLAGLVAGAVTFALLEGVRRGFLLRRGRSGLGFGDVKLLTALALWLRLATPWAVIVAALIGLGVVALTRPIGGRIAFGPSIAAGAMILGLAIQGGLVAVDGAVP
ncbi:MAG: prepilin peptidase [Caulobacter sp.]